MAPKSPAACLDNRARVWDSRTGRQILELKGHTGMLRDIAYAPDGRRIVYEFLGRNGQDLERPNRPEKSNPEAGAWPG